MIDYKSPPFEYITTQEKLDKVCQEVISKREIISVDVESDGLDPHSMNLLLIQIGTPEMAYVINAKLDTSTLKDILENEKIIKILQNAKFDYSALKVIKEIEIINIFDTMLAERILTMGVERENSLGAIVRKYTGVELDKDWESLDWMETVKLRKFTTAQLKYSANDVLSLFPVYEKQNLALEKEGLMKVANLEFKLVQVVAEIEIKGSLIDVKKWKENLSLLEARRTEIAAKIQQEMEPFYKIKQVDLFGNSHEVLNLNSPAQILEAFRTKLGIDLPSTGSEILAKCDHPMAKLLLQYREVEKLLTSFGETLLEKVHRKTGRLHPDFMQIGADTGRFACSNPNLQQIPSDSAFRSCFIPPNGYKMIVADYSQIELRIMADLSEDPEFMEAFNTDQDLHLRTASQMYDVPIEKVDKKMRFNAKSINFGLMYGRGANSLAGQLGVTVEEAEKLLEKYFSTYRKVKAWLDKAGKDALKRGYSQTLSGRKRWFRPPDPGDPTYRRQISHIERQGKNTPIQGSSADMTKIALVNIFRALRKGGYEAYPIHTVHDEIVVEVREDQANEVRDLVEKMMVEAGNLLLKKVPTRVDAKVTDVWQH